MNEYYGIFKVIDSLDNIKTVLDEGWNLKKKMSASIVNPHIQQISDYALKSGATSIKLLGAGGGGFLLVVGSENVHKKMGNRFSLKQINFSMSPYGARVYSELY